MRVHNSKSVKHSVVMRVILIAVLISFLAFEETSQCFPNCSRETIQSDRVGLKYTYTISYQAIMIIICLFSRVGYATITYIYNIMCLCN